MPYGWEWTKRDLNSELNDSYCTISMFTSSVYDAVLSGNIVISLMSDLNLMDNYLDLFSKRYSLAHSVSENGLASTEHPIHGPHRPSQRPQCGTGAFGKDARRDHFEQIGRADAGPDQPARRSPRRQTDNHPRLAGRQWQLYLLARRVWPQVALLQQLSATDHSGRDPACSRAKRRSAWLGSRATGGITGS